MLEVLVDQHRCDDQDDEVLEQQQGKRSKAKNKTIFMTLDFSLLNLCILIECNLWNVITLQNNFICGKSSLTNTKCIYSV